MKKCAFLTLDEVGDFVIDDEHAINPLAELGWEVSTLSWRQRDRAWSDFDIAIIRSTWDYWNDVPEFLETLEYIDTETRLANRLELVRWNLVKTYMSDLEADGIGIVPTFWADSPGASSFAGFQDQLGTDNIVIKPIIGANGDDAYWITPGDTSERLEKIAARFPDRKCMIQPFMPNITSEGEYSLFFFNGQYSHAILKTPAESEFRSQEEHGGEIRAIQPEELLLTRAQQAIDTLVPQPLYARIDFVRNELRDFVVMELELIEPSMYLRMDPQAPFRFAAAIDYWAKQ